MKPEDRLWSKPVNENPGFLDLVGAQENNLTVLANAQGQVEQGSKDLFKYIQQDSGLGLAIVQLLELQTPKLIELGCKIRGFGSNAMEGTTKGFSAKIEGTNLQFDCEFSGVVNEDALSTLRDNINSRVEDFKKHDIRVTVKEDYDLLYGSVPPAFHLTIDLAQPDLFDKLEKAMIAREMQANNNADGAEAVAARREVERRVAALKARWCGEGQGVSGVGGG